MCRNIKRLANFDPPATSVEIRASALQYVHKLSGIRTVSKQNQDVFERAVAEIANASERLLSTIIIAGPPKNREIEIQKAKVRNQKRFGTPPAS